MTHFWQFCGILDTVRSVLSSTDFMKTIFLMSYIFLTGDGGEISPNKKGKIWQTWDVAGEGQPTVKSSFCN